jgi:CRP/FNR family transcriptional regulator, cyclic AMP receptor protein
MSADQHLPEKRGLHKNKVQIRPNSPHPRNECVDDELFGARGIRQPSLLIKLLALDPDLRSAIMKFKRYPAGELIFQQSDRQRAIFVIKSGAVRTFYTAPTGREITLAYWQEGDLLGADRMYEEGIFRWSSQTVSATEVYMLSDAAMRSLIVKVPELAIAFVETLSFKVQWLSSLVQMLATESVSGRLGFLLDTLCELYGMPTDHGIMINTPFTHEDLAAMVGASRQWVTMALDRFQERGVLKLGMRRIEVLHRDRLVLSSPGIVSTR